jgi:hypothetical protein
MKKLLVVLLAFILTSCSSSKLTDWDTDLRSSGYDFRSYTAQGFLFTPETYTEPYNAVGLVEIIYQPEIKYISPSLGVPTSREGYRLMTFGTQNYLVELPDTDILIDEMYELATNLGADALTNFQITNELIYNNDAPIETIKVSGFAIKRLE